MASTRVSPTNALCLERLSLSKKPLLQLFCFPYAGGSPLVFRPWRRHLPSQVDLCLVHLPGHGKRFGEPPLTRLSAVVEAITPEIRSELQVPFAVYGHSMGGTICFELAREIQRQYGIKPAHIFISGRRAPHLCESESAAFHLPHDEFIAELKRLNGTPKEVLDNPEATELFLPILRADFEIVDTYKYHPGERLSCPITVYGGLQDKDVPVKTLRGWQEHTSGAFKLRMFPGDHFFIHASSAQFLDSLRNDLLIALHNLAR